MKNFNKGFTLIELLIVIALLGALAVGLLAALDPFEQLKKGTDTSTRNTVSEVHGAAVRYYAIKNQMPWCANADCSTKTAGFTEDTAVTLDKNPAMIANIVSTGELKADFSSLAGDATLAKITVFGNNTNAAITVCYKPTAKSFTSDPNTKFSPTNGVSTDDGGECVRNPDPATNTCLWCVK